MFTLSLAATSLVHHPLVKAVTFVGTTHIARLLYSSSLHSQGKRVLALGGAKNHLIAAPDCQLDMTSTDVVNSFSGCSGQRCMAASVLLLIGSQDALVEDIVKKASAITPGSDVGQMGPVIDKGSLDKIHSYIQESKESGATILLDGRDWTQKHTKGYWIGPTVLLHSHSNDKAMKEEIFGPVLSIYQCETTKEALDIENSNEYGNAACIYTTSGMTAEYFTKRMNAGMIGVNIGVPVPREPFSFGGMNKSKFGNSDITGDGGIEFFTERKKITTKWQKPDTVHWLS